MELGLRENVGGKKRPLRATVHWIKIEGTVENHFTDISGECHDENLGKKVTILI